MKSWTGAEDLPQYEKMSTAFIKRVGESNLFNCPTCMCGRPERRYRSREFPTARQKPAPLKVW